MPIPTKLYSIQIADASENPTNAVVKIDSTTGKIPQSFIPSAPKLSTPRSISLTGGVTGSTTFDGSTNASITTTVNSLAASAITSGTIDIARLPAGALERLIIVANATARFALTTTNVQLGDTVKQTDTGMMYYVKDISNLANENGYEIYNAGNAQTVNTTADTTSAMNLCGVTSTATNTIKRNTSITMTGADLSTSGTITAGSVVGAVYNDYADALCLEDNESIQYGKCYRIQKNGKVTLCDERCQVGSIGIASDTFSIIIGMDEDVAKVPIAVAGFALAYVDDEYEIGTKLVNNIDGTLTKATSDDIIKFPERIIGWYMYREQRGYYGVNDRSVAVNGRSWIKVV